MSNTSDQNPDDFLCIYMCIYIYTYIYIGGVATQIFGYYYGKTL